MSDKKQLENELKEIKDLLAYMLEKENNKEENNILNDTSTIEKFMNDYAQENIKPINIKKFIGYVEFMDTELNNIITVKEHKIPILRFRNIYDKNLKKLKLNNIYTNNKEWIAYNYKNVFKKLINVYELKNNIKVARKHNINKNIAGVFKLTFDVDLESGIIDYDSIEILDYFNTYNLMLDTIENMKIKSIYYNFDVDDNDLYFEIDDYEKEIKKYYSKNIKLLNDWKLLIKDLIDGKNNICLIYEEFNEKNNKRNYYIVNENNNLELIDNVKGEYLKLHTSEKYNSINNNYTLLNINNITEEIKSNYKNNSIYLAKVLYDEESEIFNVYRIIYRENIKDIKLKNHVCDNIHDLI